jgi:hypothetical protein
MSLTLDNLYKIIREYYPLTFKYDKEWHNNGFKIAKQMMKKYNNSRMAELYAMKYYLANFNEPHFYLHFDMDNLQYTGFITIYDFKNDKLKIVNSNEIITHINNKPFKEYMNDFILFNNGIKNDKADLFYNSFILFIDWGNPFLNAPKNITINNKIITFNYISLTNQKLQYIYNYKNSYIYKNLMPKYKLYKKKNTIHFAINSFDTIDYTEFKKLLPADKIIVDLKFNQGGIIDNMAYFFKIVYNLDIKLGIDSKQSLFKSDNWQRKCSYPILDEKINHPKLEIIVNEFSKSACGLFVQIARYFIDNVKITGNIHLYKLCGSSMNFRFGNYSLDIPTHCSFCKDIIKD